jgi:methylenetetrahydrofolate--tRNA-(uracil-5-)-methyltransferase
MNVNFGLLPPLAERAPKRDRRRLYAERATAAFASWV